tara:strand:+ start:25 stop:492 length:468 start_codon:yes stop_codon:yes gene_type:complete
MSKKEIQITTSSTSNIILASIAKLKKPLNQEEKNILEVNKIKNSLSEIDTIYGKMKYLKKRIDFQNIHTAQIKGQILYNDKMRYVTHSFRQKHNKLNSEEIFNDYVVQLKENRTMLNNWYDNSQKQTKKFRRILEELRQQKNKERNEEDFNDRSN